MNWSNIVVQVLLLSIVPSSRCDPTARTSLSTGDSIKLSTLVAEVRSLKTDLRELKELVESIRSNLPVAVQPGVNKTQLAKDVWDVLERHLGTGTVQQPTCVLGSILSMGITEAGQVAASSAAIPKTPPFTAPSPSKLGKFKSAAITSDCIPCSEAGREVMAEGGNAIDAAITALFANGVVNPHSAGIGGGFLMTIYDPVNKTARCLDARETAPAAASETMYRGNAFLSQTGGLSVAVPGELAGYWAAHQVYGKLPWLRLVQPAIALAENGVKVNKHLALILKTVATTVKAEPSLWTFLNEKTGEVLQENDTFRLPQLARTMKEIAEKGIDVFYKGHIGSRLVEDVQRRGGILSREDLAQYRAEWMDPVAVELNDNLTLYSVPSPGSGSLVAYAMNILDGQINRPTISAGVPTSKNPLTYHRIAEALKHAFAQRTKLGDPRFVPEVVELTKKLSSEDFAADTFAKISDSSTSADPAFYGANTYNPEDKGTSHVSVLDANGMAVSVTTTVNLYFGAGFISKQTGILLNDEMDDFSSPNVTNFFGVEPSPANFIQPGKRPLSSMTPTIVVNSSSGRVRSVTGAAGGTRITTAVVYTLIRNLWFGEDLKEAIDSRRLHHQLLPMTLYHESGFPANIITSLMSKGHNVTESPNRSAVYAITVEPDGYIYANADYRKGGDVAGLNSAFLP